MKIRKDAEMFANKIQELREEIFGGFKVTEWQPIIDWKIDICKLKIGFYIHKKIK